VKHMHSWERRAVFCFFSLTFVAGAAGMLLKNLRFNLGKRISANLCKRKTTSYY